LEDAVYWVCLDALWLEPGESLWIVKDDMFFDGSFEQVVQWDSGQLANEGERILLKDASGIVVDFVEYGTEAPWPVPVAGAEALVRVSPWLDNHFASSWMLAELDEVLTLEDQAQNGWSVYPNPAKNTVRVSLEEKPVAPVQLQCFNLTGQCINEWSVLEAGVEFTLDVSAFPAGVYMLRFKGRSRLIQIL
jgi:hypothetical protein